MNAMCSNQNVASLAPSQMEDERSRHPQPANFLYQAATVLAILLMLFSF